MSSSKGTTPAGTTVSGDHQGHDQVDGETASGASTQGATTQGATAAALPSTWRLGWVCTHMELRQFFRQRESMMFTFAFPIIMLLIFGTIFGDATIAKTDVTIRQYFVAGMIATGVMLSSFQSLGIWIAMERDDGTLKRLRGTPLPAMAYFLGKIGMVLISSVVQTVLLFAVGALFFDISLPSTPQLWLRLGWVFLLGVSAGTVLGIAASSLARNGRSAPAVISPIAIVLQFISGVYFVFGQLPGWLQTVGAIFPLKWLAQGIRACLLPDAYQLAEPAGSWELGRTALILLAWLIVGLLVCLRTFRWLPQGER